MSFNITLGNLDQHLTGPSNPTAVGQVITPAGNHKFTVHGVAAGVTLGPLAMNIPFAHWYGIRQTQKGGVSFGFCDEAGHPIGAQNVDQGMAMVGAGGSVPLYFKATFHTAGDFTFTGGAG